MAAVHFLRLPAFAAALGVALAGCAAPPPPTEQGGMQGGVHGGMRALHEHMAVASLGPTQGSAVQGVVVFHQMGDHVRVHARVTGLKPNAEHGFHVHDKGDCASTDGMSAGGHYNPTAKPHGEQAGEHHGGDMPNLKADADGVADQTFTLMGVGIGSAPDLVGHALIVHAGPDDYKTQPTGNSGARLACGLIAKMP